MKGKSLSCHSTASWPEHMSSKLGSDDKRSVNICPVNFLAARAHGEAASEATDVLPRLLRWRLERWARAGYPDTRNSIHTLVGTWHPSWEEKDRQMKTSVEERFSKKLGFFLKKKILGQWELLQYERLYSSLNFAQELFNQFESNRLSVLNGLDRKLVRIAIILMVKHISTQVVTDGVLVWVLLNWFA